jgi:dephospho-CoA kinase
MLVVGLTGGIGSGKSTVARLFEAKGVPVIDADQIARDLVQPGQPALNEIRQAFGDVIDAGTGCLDRRHLAERVFADPAARRRLESILHPRIRRIMQHRVARLQSPYAILVIPLLLEAGQTDLVDRVLVVDLPEAEQLRRVEQRDQRDEAQIRAIMANQVPRLQRLQAADDIIDNAGGMDELRRQTNRLHRCYLELADWLAG